jgi:hypothetical protein
MSGVSLGRRTRASGHPGANAQFVALDSRLRENDEEREGRRPSQMRLPRASCGWHGACTLSRQAARPPQPTPYAGIPVFQPSLDVAMQKNVAGYRYWFHRQLDYRQLAKT